MRLLNDLLVNSCDGDYAKIIGVITRFLKKHTKAKIIIEKISPKKSNIIALFGKPSLLINCHMDTVSAVGAWKTNPFKLAIKSGKAYGLGACDTKGNIYCVLEAVKNISQDNLNNLMLLFSVDEESSSMAIESGAAYFLRSKYSKNIRNVIVCEPTQMEFVTKHKGYSSFGISIKTKGGHSSLKGNNAIVIASLIVQKLNSLGYNIGKITGGKHGNVIADECSIHVSIRSYGSTEEILQQILHSVKNISGLYLDTASVTPRFSGPAFVNENPFIKSRQNEVGYWTEAALFSNAGKNAVVFGAGNIQEAHTANEFVKISGLQSSKKIFERLIADFN